MDNRQYLVLTIGRCAYLTSFRVFDTLDAARNFVKSNTDIYWRGQIRTVSPDATSELVEHF